MLPTNLKTEVDTMFAQFEIRADNLGDDEKKAEINKILKHITNNAEAYEISREDINGFFLVKFCAILDYYGIASDLCHTIDVTEQTNVPLEDTAKKDSGGGLPGWLKVILRIIFGGILIVGGTIVFFAVKAKLKDTNQDEEEEE